MLVSSLLYAIVLIVTIMENEKEADMLYVLGIDKKDIFKSYMAQSSIYCFGAFALSFVCMIGLEFGVHGYIGSNFGGASSFRFSLSPIVAMLSFSLAVFLISGVFLLRFASKGRSVH